MSAGTTTPPKPKRIIREGVSPIEVGREYLKAEFGRLFPGGEAVRSAIDSRIDELDEKKFWRLLEALSFTYRLNWVFFLVGDIGRRWNEEEWAISDLTLTGMNPKIDAVTHSPEINQNPLKFGNYLKKYFTEDPNDDPQGLGKFRLDERALWYPRILLRESEGELLLLDGTSRLIRMVLEGKERVTAFVARKMETEGKVRVGDSTFYLLRWIYERSESEDERAAIIEAVKSLMEGSLDGRKAVRTYWVKHIRDESLREVGEKLLS